MQLQLPQVPEPVTNLIIKASRRAGIEAFTRADDKSPYQILPSLTSWGQTDKRLCTYPFSKQQGLCHEMELR